MPRSRPASDPLSFHRPTGQFYVTRGRKRIYLGSDKSDAKRRYHALALGQLSAGSARQEPANRLTVKELANRFIGAQRANWRNPELTLPAYKNWLGRFIADHPGLIAEDFTVEMFAA